MAMSRDRIEFTLTTGNADEEIKEATARAATRAFNLTPDNARFLLSQEVRIRCRPSQFGRFIVFRVEEGVKNNRISNLEVELIAPKPVRTTVDVSSNDA